jgi:hypothetical protein
MRTIIRTGQLAIIGYLEKNSGNREILRDKTGQILGRFERDIGVTRDASGNNLLKIAKALGVRVRDLVDGFLMRVKRVNVCRQRS